MAPPPESPSAPPPLPELMVAAAAHLLHRATGGSEPALAPLERLRHALAICHTPGAKDLPEALRCRAHIAAGTLLHEHTEDHALAIGHLRSALQACGRIAGSDWDCWLEAVTAALRVIKSLLRSGMLKESKVLLECVRGVLQHESSGHEAAPWLSAHCGALHVSLLVREGQFAAAGRMVTSARDAVVALPRDAASVPGLHSWATRDELLRVLSLHSTLILARQGAHGPAREALDELLSACAVPARDARQAAVAAEAKLLRAALAIARMDFETALETLKDLHAGLHSDDEHASSAAGAKASSSAAASAAATAVTSSSGAASAAATAVAPRCPSGRTVWKLLLAQLAMALGERSTALELVDEAMDVAQLKPGRRATAAHGASGSSAGAQGASGSSAGARSATLAQWCELLRLLLRVPSPKAQLEALDKMLHAEEGKPQRLLRSAIFLVQGHASLALGQHEDAERRLKKCIKDSASESRCDALAAPALAALAAAVGPRADDPAIAAAPTADAAEALRAQKKRRAEDALSSALIIGAKMFDEHMRRRALESFTAFYEVVGDMAHAAEFGELLTQHMSEYNSRLAAARETQALSKLRRL